MEQNTRQENQTAKQIAALHTISKKYQTIIASDPIIQHDMEELMRCLRTSSPSSRQHCEKIIKHLLTEIHGSVEDEHRMDDEGPTCQNTQNTFNEQDYFRFKDAMTDFQLHHFNQP